MAMRCAAARLAGMAPFGQGLGESVRMLRDTKTYRQRVSAMPSRRLSQIVRQLRRTHGVTALMVIMVCTVLIDCATLVAQTDAQTESTDGGSVQSASSGVATGQSPMTERLPVVGLELPVQELYDENGSPFSTVSFRDHYTVLVFGCLT